LFYYVYTGVGLDPILKGLDRATELFCSGDKVDISSVIDNTYNDMRKMGRKYPLLIWLMGLGESHELSERGPGWSPGWKWFYCNLNSADRLCWQQVTANSSPFRPEKWGYGTPQSKSGGTGTPRTPANYAYAWDILQLQVMWFSGKKSQMSRSQITKCKNILKAIECPAWVCTSVECHRLV